MKNETESRECCGPECCSTEDENIKESTEPFDDEQLKQIVRNKYSEIALSKSEENCGCGGGCSTDDKNFSSDYSNLSGYVPEADLGLGCGLPTKFAGITPGDTVVDLGSGAGNDVFIASGLAGEKGNIIGIDFSPEMIERANKNKTKLGFSNVEFRFGEIENLPVNDSAADVVVSNCVLNLVPNKLNAFSEIYRILKRGGHFCVSDIVNMGKLPNALKRSAEIYAGCVSGAIEQDEYIGIITNAGFRNTRILESKRIYLPDEILRKYLSEKETVEFNESNSGIFSITVTGYKM